MLVMLSDAKKFKFYLTAIYCEEWCEKLVSWTTINSYWCKKLDLLDYHIL